MAAVLNSLGGYAWSYAILLLLFVLLAYFAEHDDLSCLLLYGRVSSFMSHTYFPLSHAIFYSSIQSISLQHVLVILYFVHPYHLSS